MNLPPEQARELAQFPAPLRALVEAELAAGNQIAELAHGFPAAPCGAYIKLTHAVTSRPRAKTAEFDFYDRNSRSHAGEFTDAKRHFFVLEPPRPAESEPDMDMIRGLQAARNAAGNFGTTSSEAIGGGSKQESAAEREIRARAGARPDSIVDRFVASMTIDYEKWHDGVGYDMELLKVASPGDLIAIENLLLERGCSDWRDVETLAALGTKRARKALEQAHATGKAEVRLAVHRYAPELLTEKQRVSSLAQALAEADFGGGLSQALDEVAEFHPPEVVAALLHGLMERDGTAACHFAAMLYFIHGRAASAFDLNQRPFFLRFNTGNLVEREIALRELCQELAVDPSRCIRAKRT